MATRGASTTLGRRTVGVVTSAAPSRGRPGRKPTLSRDDVVTAALEVVDSQGFQALSLRAVARQLDVAPMNLYTYVEDSAELEVLVIERVIAHRTAEVVWPEDWRACLLAFAEGLDALVHEHPAMLEAYARGAVRTPTALQVADLVLGRLRAGGLSVVEALTLYEAVHALVLGHALLARSATATTPVVPVDLPYAAEAFAAGLRQGRTRLRSQLGLLLAGMDSTVGPPGRP